MIRLEKSAEPEILIERGAEWTKVVCDKIAADEEPTAAEKSRYRHPQIKNALVRETFGKCAYCESKLLHIHHGDVEHIYPKSLDPRLMFVWANLTLACEKCNQLKSDLDPLVENIIDPYNSDPTQHLVFQGAFVFPLGSALGVSTHAILDLNRAPLVERRGDVLVRIMAVYNEIFRNDIPLVARRAIYEDFVDTLCAPSGQYSAMANGVRLAMEPRLPAEILS